MRNRWSGSSFDTSDTDIEHALRDVSVPTLMLSLVHITGDLGLIRGAIKPNGLFLNEVQGFMSEEAKAEVRSLALDILRDYRDQGCPEPKSLPAEALKEMMEWLVCEPVADDYVPMLLEELGIGGLDGCAEPNASNRDKRARFNVVVIGAGQSGLLAGIRLQQMGIAFTIVEKNPGVGGTWWENTYPGARVDVGNHFYCYRFEPNNDWSEYFAQQPELQDYFARVARSYAIEPRIRFNTEVLGAVWDDDRDLWHVRVVDASGAEQLIEANAVISAVGQLNRPKIAQIAGQESFAGPAFHSACWDHDLDLTGKSVAMVGAGASGFQIAPAIAERVGRLTIFQRTAQWMFPNPDYHKRVGGGVKWALQHLPFYGRWYRLLLFWPGCEKGREAALIDPDYTGDRNVAVSELNDAARMMFTEWIKSQVGDDAELLDKVLPDYPACGKRTLQDDGSWLQTLRRENVELVRTPIDHIDADAIVTQDGQRYPVDVIVYATGFHTNRALWPMQVTGCDGADLRSIWGERPAAFLGITVPGFPNFFCMYGPGTNLAHGGSLIMHSECQIRYISSALGQLIDSGFAAMEPLPDTCADWHRRSQAEIGKLVWSEPSVKHSFYKNSLGEIHSLSPWRLVDYWTWTRRADLDDYRLR